MENSDGSEFSKTSRAFSTTLWPVSKLKTGKFESRFFPIETPFPSWIIDVRSTSDPGEAKIIFK